MNSPEMKQSSIASPHDRTALLVGRESCNLRPGERIPRIGSDKRLWLYVTAGYRLAARNSQERRLIQSTARGNSMNNVTGVVRLLKKEQERLTKELRGIGAALAAFGNAYGNGTGTRKVSAAARARMAAAQKARWAKVREMTKVVPIRGKRALSAAGRKRIAAAQRARWARVKAGKKTT